MDDGTNNGGVVIQTDSYTIKEVELLISALNTNFGLISYIRFERKKSCYLYTFFSISFITLISIRTYASFYTLQIRSLTTILICFKLKLMGDPILYQHLFLNTKLCTIPVATMASPFSFSTFYSVYTKRYPNAQAPSQSFLEWLVGFAEGDGCFTVNSRGTGIFVITQSTRDIQILQYIKQNLGFGRVIKQGTNTSRFVVEELSSVALIVSLFNGNLVFPTNKASFSLFLDAFNKRSKAKVVGFLPSLVTPTLNDYWLCGITDAEGCFSCSMLGNSKAYRFRFLLAQLWESNLFVLKHITTLIGGVVRPHSAEGVNELTLNGVRNMVRVFDYFDTHQLLTNKAKSYLIWREVHTSIVNGEHLSPESRAVLKAKAATINS
jgi:hypothetical protein